MEAKRSIAPLIATVVILAIVIIGAFYLWGNRFMKPSQASQATSVAPVSPSDDVNSIEGDLQATTSAPDLSGLNNL